MLWSETIKIPDELKEKVELFKKWSPYNNQNLDQQEENLKRELKDLSANEDDEEGYIEEVGDENAEKGSSRKAAIKEQLRQIREAIKVKSATEEAVGIIHGMLEALFVKVTKTDEGNKPSYIVIKQNSAPSFEAALLDTYISHPALPKIFMSIAGQFEMLATEVTQAMWVEEMVRRADIGLMNDAEARMLFKTPNLVACAKHIMSLDSRYAIIKKGENGVVLFSKDSYFALPGFALENIKDPTGCGDSFAGAFLGYLAQTRDTDEANIRRALVAASVIASFNAEDFSFNRLLSLTQTEIRARTREFRKIVFF